MGGSRRFVVLGSRDSNRVEFFQEALARLGQPPALFISWLDLLAGRVDLRDMVTADCIVRIESPGKDFSIERALLALGADMPDEEGEVYKRIPRRDCELLTFDKGLIHAPRQWYLGFRAALQMISKQLGGCMLHSLFNTPGDIAAMFDKPRCHALFSQQGLPVPLSLPGIHSYNDLTARMQESGCRRVFVKLAHGSSASGVVAYQTDGRRSQATTTVEMAESNGQVRLYNSRHLKTYREPSEIARLIDALCRHRVHVEQWLPKAGIADHAFDLRVVVIGGQARHIVARLSRSPITNLHLLNQRGNVQAIQDKMGEAAWADAMKTCEQAMRSFPQSHYAGLDLLIAPDFRRHAILEINAFGDLLPRVLSEGKDTYSAEIETLCSTPTL